MRRGGVAQFWVLGAGASALALAVPAQADTLQEALTNAYLYNPTLLAARANQRANDENVQIQEAPGIPSVNASGTYIEFIKKSPNSFTSPDRTLQIGPELTVPVYAGGAVRNAVKAARRGRKICARPRAQFSARSWPLTWTCCARRRWSRSPPTRSNS